MKAVRIHEYGDRSVLKLEDVEIPKIGEDEVLIKIIATSINPVDWKIRYGYLKEMINYELPLILGWDLAGIVEKVGTSVKEFKVGDEVFSRPELARNGTYAEYIAVKANEVAIKPKTISFSEAASLPLVGITAWESIINAGNIKNNQKVLIHGASGGVGVIAVQLAKWKGAHVIATTSTKNIEFVKSLGADEIIDYTKNNFQEIVNDVDLVFDTIGGKVQEASLKVLKKGGILVSITSPIDQNKLNELGIIGKFVFIKPDNKILSEIASLVDSGIIRPIIAKEFSLENIISAHELSESGHTRGKIIVNIGKP